MWCMTNAWTILWVIWTDYTSHTAKVMVNLLRQKHQATNFNWKHIVLIIFSMWYIILFSPCIYQPITIWLQYLDYKTPLKYKCLCIGTVIEWHNRNIGYDAVSFMSFCHPLLRHLYLKDACMRYHTITKIKIFCEWLHNLKIIWLTSPIAYHFLIIDNIFI